jgi:hypothetical protein
MAEMLTNKMHSSLGSLIIAWPYKCRSPNNPNVCRVCAVVSLGDEERHGFNGFHPPYSNHRSPGHFNTLRNNCHAGMDLMARQTDQTDWMPESQMLFRDPFLRMLKDPTHMWKDVECRSQDRD